MNIVLSGNSPGELWGWVRPLASAIREHIPDASLSLFLFPCQYATGKEGRVARDLIGIKTVVSPRESIRYILFGKSPPGFSAADPVLIHLGGDLMYASRLARRLRARAYAYQWGERFWDRAMRGYFVTHERQKETLISRKIPENKIMVVGDLVVDGIQMELSGGNGKAGAGGGYRVGLFPGSRGVELRHLLPFYLRVCELVKEEAPETAFTLALSPFVEDQEVATAIDRTQKHVLESGSGILTETDQGKFIETGQGLKIRVSVGNQYQVMRESDCILTIPGTKCGEAGLLGIPMLVTLPTNKLEEIPYPGVPALLEKIPLGGRRMKRWLLAAMLPRFGFVSQPNILAGEEVVPEIVGELTPRRVADALLELLRDEKRRRAIASRLNAIYGAIKPGARNMISVIAGNGA